jgi:hypothetical protein
MYGPPVHGELLNRVHFRDFWILLGLRVRDLAILVLHLLTTIARLVPIRKSIGARNSERRAVKMSLPLRDLDFGGAANPSALPLLNAMSCVARDLL